MFGPPSGTVTFLFTDIEGSTALLHELGADRYADALAEHRRVLRASFASHATAATTTKTARTGAMLIRDSTR